MVKVLRVIRIKIIKRLSNLVLPESIDAPWPAKPGQVVVEVTRCRSQVAFLLVTVIQSPSAVVKNI